MYGNDNVLFLLFCAFWCLWLLALLYSRSQAKKAKKAPTSSTIPTTATATTMTSSHVQLSCASGIPEKKATSVIELSVVETTHKALPPPYTAIQVDA